jgi:hypothetical protein
MDIKNSNGENELQFKNRISDQAIKQLLYSSDDYVKFVYEIPTHEIERF